MMPSPPINDSYDTCNSAGSQPAAPKFALIRSIAPVAIPTWSFYPQIARSPQRAHTGFAENRSRQPILSNLINPKPAAKSP